MNHEFIPSSFQSFLFMRIVYLFIVGLLFLIPQITWRFYIFKFQFQFDFMTLLVIYAAFQFPLVRGLIAVTALGVLLESMSYAYHGLFVIVHIVLFMIVTLIHHRIYTESYLTKGLWIFILSVVYRLLLTFAWSTQIDFFGLPVFWVETVLQALFNALLGFPFFRLLDKTLPKWMSLVGRSQGDIKGSDFYQVNSDQTKFFR